MSETTILAAPEPELPKGLAVCRRFLHRIGQAELTIATLALIVVVVLSFAQAFLRYTFGTSLWWAQEVAESTIVISYFLGVSYVFKTRQYILIEFVSLLLPVRGQLLLYVFAQIVTIVFTVALVVLVFQFAPTLLKMTTPVLRLPGIISALPIGIASALMVLTSLYYLAFALWALFSNALSGSMTETERLGLVTRPLEDLEW